MLSVPGSCTTLLGTSCPRLSPCCCKCCDTHHCLPSAFRHISFLNLSWRLHEPSLGHLYQCFPQIIFFIWSVFVSYHITAKFIYFFLFLRNLCTPRNAHFSPFQFFPCFQLRLSLYFMLLLLINSLSSLVLPVCAWVQEHILEQGQLFRGYIHEGNWLFFP